MSGNESTWIVRQLRPTPGHLTGNTYLEVRKRGVEVDTPVDQSIGSVDALALVECNKGLDDGFAEGLKAIRALHSWHS